jgi:hypothetical protein
VVSNLLRLVVRRWIVNRKAQIASILITAAVLTAWMLFWGYAEATSQATVGRIVVPEEPTDLIVLAPDGEASFSEPRSVGRVGAFRKMLVDTSYGSLDLGAITYYSDGELLPQAAMAEVWVSDQLAEHWQLRVGDTFPLRFRQEFEFTLLTAHVGGVYPASSFLPDVLVDGGWLIAQGVELPAESYLFYKQLEAGEMWEHWLHHLTAGNTRVTSNTILAEAQEVVKSTLSGGGSAIALLFMLMVLGVGTFSMLSYMDSRKELAILKSMGLRPKEAGAIFWLESLVSVSLGWLLAAFTANLLARVFPFQVLLTASVYVRSLCGVLAALLAATIIPSLLGQKAGVLELMFNRPVAMFRSHLRELKRRHPALEEKVAAGYRCIKLPTPEGRFAGICLRRAGQMVKENETVAWESHTWGMGERHYLAPCDGEVVECDLTSGLIVIKPASR